jgi:hypothetical protein
MTPVRKSTALFAGFGFLLMIATGLSVHGARLRRSEIPVLERTAALVRTNGLTDLCLFPDANYTRHLSQSDLNAPFQSGPMTLEHFPSGSLAGPPARGWR